MSPPNSNSKQNVGRGSFSEEEARAIAEKFFNMEKGIGAIIITDYPDINKKRGVAWEASREVNATLNQRLFSCIKLGSLPIDIKARKLAATGSGVTGKIYALNPTDIDLTGLTTDKFYNKHGNSTATPQMQLYVVPQDRLLNGATDLDVWLEARKCGADIHARTNIQNQAKGFLDRAFNSDRVFDPAVSDKIVLFEILSLEAQWVSAYLDVYEGFLDFSLGEGGV